MDRTGYRALEDRLGLSSPLPISPGWSATADFLERLADYCLLHHPRLILECGSGASTIVLARCCQINGLGRIISLEHDAHYAESTRQALASFGMTEHAQVIHAPLRSTALPGQTGCADWYDISGPDLPEIDFVVIDGPPAWNNPHARYPALPLLHDRLKQKCTLMLDDAARAGEMETAQAWAREFPEFIQRYLETERGCLVLERTS